MFKERLYVYAVCDRALTPSLVDRPDPGSVFSHTCNNVKGSWSTVNLAHQGPKCSETDGVISTVHLTGRGYTRAWVFRRVSERAFCGKEQEKSGKRARKLTVRMYLCSSRDHQRSSGLQKATLGRQNRKPGRQGAAGRCA